MKPLNSILVAISVLVITSCTFSNRTNSDNIKRQDVLGFWTLSTESLNKIKKENPTASTIKSFQLNSDSTVMVSYANSGETKRSGKWVWKAKKKLGNDNFGVSLNTDVAIFVNGMIALGLQLNKTDGKINLTARDYLFEKQ